MPRASRKDSKPASTIKKNTLSNRTQSQITKPVVTSTKSIVNAPKDKEATSAIKKKANESKILLKLEIFSDKFYCGTPYTSQPIIFLILYRTYRRRSGSKKKQNFQNHIKISKFYLNSSFRSKLFFREPTRIIAS